MSATVLQLRPQSPPLAGYLRLGHTGHRKLAELEAAGRFPFRRVVVDAAHWGEQADLAAALKSSGREIVLDPNFAEMAAPGRFASSSLQRLEWSKPDQPWKPEDLGARQNYDVAKSIAEFAVQSGVHAILTPTHFLDVTNQAWRAADLRLCEALRHELDRCGGREIAIDFQLITTTAALRDEAFRKSLISEVTDLPVENFWLRASGFGASATGAGTRAFVECIRPLHGLNRPVIVDMAGGLPGLATLALGAAAGISHGVGQKESFRANDWNKPPVGGGGASARAYLPELDRYLKEEQLQAIFAARGGRSRFACNDGRCCPGGADDMIENAHAHFLTQRHRQIDDLSTIPDARRAEHFLLHHVDPAIRTARYGTQLKVENEQVMAVLSAAKARMIRLRDALADLEAGDQTVSRSLAAPFRGGASSVSAMLGR